MLHLPFKSVIVLTFNSFLYYIPVIQEFFSTSIFIVYIDWIKVVMKSNSMAEKTQLSFQ